MGINGVVFLDILTVITLVGGAFFFTIGTVGYLRFPDVFCRLHATTKCDTLGIGLIILGLIIHSFPSLGAVKLIFMLIFIWFSNPTASHIIAKAVYDTDVKECEERGCQENGHS